MLCLLAVIKPLQSNRGYTLITALLVPLDLIKLSKKMKVLIMLWLLLCLEWIDPITAAAGPTAFVGRIRRASASSANYVTIIQLGTPPQPVTFAIDTRAHIITTSTANFNPSISSTYRLVSHKKMTLSSDTAIFNSTNGLIPTAPLKLKSIHFKLEDAKDHEGVLALGVSPLAFPTQLSAAAKIANKFAYCLSGYEGVYSPIFFGSTSYFLDSGLPPGPDNSPERNFTSALQYTPLILSRGKRGSSLYTVEITSIAVTDQMIGHATTTIRVGDVAVIGTGDLHTSIVEPAYTLIRQAFLRAADVSGFPKAKGHHGPLDLCYNLTFGHYQSAPIISFKFGGGMTVSLSADNYMEEVGDSSVFCFGIVSAGAGKGSSAIGTLQQMDNLVEIDQEKNRVGISGSLVGARSNCGNFNFSATATT